MTNDPRILVDPQDEHLLTDHKWTISRRAGTEYARRMTPRPESRAIYLHHAVLGLTQQVDHRNGNGLDNRRANLRFASHSQNLANSRKRRSVTTSRYKGVSWHRRGQKWMAQIGGPGQRYLGLFKSEEAAARAYDAAAREKWGDFAATNFPSKEEMT